MNSAIKNSLERHLNLSIDRAYSVSGGDINQSFRLHTNEGSVFVKVNDADLLPMFEAERAGLALLRDVSALHVPEVLAVGACAGGAWLALEWVESGRRRADFDVRLGEGLAHIHRQTCPKFGLPHDNFIGSLPQTNGREQSWVTFFGQRRLGVQVKLGIDSGRLPVDVAGRVEQLIGRLDVLLPDSPEASLLHGDLWGGNYMVGAAGQPVLIDPAVYYGHREVELAFTALFGGFGDRFYQAYEAAWPLESGSSSRRDLYNVYPLLVHANLFGGHYVQRVDSVVRRYL